MHAATPHNVAGKDAWLAGWLAGSVREEFISMAGRSARVAPWDRRAWRYFHPYISRIFSSRRRLFLAIQLIPLLLFFFWYVFLESERRDFDISAIDIYYSGFASATPPLSLEVSASRDLQS